MKSSPFFLAALLFLLSACVKEQTEPNYFSASPRNISTPAEGGEMAVQVECDFTWNASLASGKWLHIKSMDKQNPSSTITLGADWTTDFDIRRDTLVIKSGSSTINIPISQQGLNTIVSTPNVILKDMATVALVINAPFSWTATPGSVDTSSPWFTISPESGKVGSTIMKVTANDPNLNVGDRTSFIKMVMGEMNFNVSVTQKQKDALLLSADKVEITDKKSSFEVICQSNVEYSITIDEDSRSWLRVNSGNTKALNEERITFSADANESDKPRKAIVTFKGSGLSETLTVCQAERSILIFDEDVIDAGSKGGTFTVDLRTNIDYSISFESSPDWVRVVAPTSVRVDRLYLEVDSNDTYSDRSAIMVVKDKNSDLSQTLTINQRQNNAIILDEKEIKIKNRRDVFTVEIKSNVEFEAIIPERDKSWLSIVKTKGLDISSVSFMAEENTGDMTRTSEIVFISEDASDTLKVVQAERDMIIVTPQMADIEFYGGQLTVDVTRNVDYSLSIEDGANWIDRLRPDVTIDGREYFKISENKTKKTRQGNIFLNGVDSQAADTLTIIQFARPSGTFLDSYIPGSYGTLGTGWKYSRQISQISTKKQENGHAFILMFPKDRNVLELTGLPETFSTGDWIEMGRVCHSSSGISSRKGSAVVMQIDGDLVWLSYEDDEKYIVKLIDWK